ncbi:sigma factor [Streptomyces sp. NPDC051064]|uniref:sigma factor n=1 Tax=Streptomyces sp. NPDC051064 TaxID=3365641 RepID=UPI0037B38E56
MKTTLDRLLAMTTPGPNGCVIFTGHVDTKGYGRFSVDKHNARAHRVAFEQLTGPAPEGMGIVHLCHKADPSCGGGPQCLHRRCLNPLHMALWTRSEISRGNTRGASSANGAKTHCPQGHPYDDTNTFLAKDGARNCRACHRARGRAWRAKAKEQAAGRRLGLRESFTALYVAQQGFVTGVILSEVRDRNFALAEDLAADAFIRAWKAWPKCRATTDAQLRAWLRTIARHTVIDHYRVKRNTAELAADPTAWQYANQPVEPTGGCYSVRSGRQLTPA